MPTNSPINNFVIAAINFFAKADYAVWLADFKIIMEYLTLAFGVILALILFKIRSLMNEQFKQIKADINLPAQAVSACDNRWAEIKRHVNSFTEAEWKLAVIEADKFVDETLKTAGFVGESMGERLMLIQPGQILSLQTLWDAHKLRNLLVHDPRYQMTHRQAIVAVEAFEETLIELGALS